MITSHIPDVHMAPTEASRNQSEQSGVIEHVQAEQENLEAKAIFKDMEKNVSPKNVDMLD